MSAGLTSSAARTTWPSARCTIAYPRCRVAAGDSALRAGIGFGGPGNFGGVYANQRTSVRFATPAERPLFDVLIGLTAVAVLLQGLWAGLFLQHDGKRDQASNWIDVHARGADIAIVLAAAATVAAILKLRRRRDLWGGAAVLTVLLVVAVLFTLASVFNGADDDASGSTAVLELAEALAKGKRPKRTLIFGISLVLLALRLRAPRDARGLSAS